jgi:hypothetical protein
MANTVALLSQTENTAVLEVTEAATAAAITSTDLVSLLNPGPLKDFLSQAFADQPAAIAALEAAQAAGFASAASAPATPIVSANIAGGVVAGNFRLETNTAKAAGGDTSVHVIRFGLPHSIVA